MGFPSPAQDFNDQRIDLNQVLITPPTYMPMIEMFAGFAIIDRTADKVEF